MWVYFWIFGDSFIEPWLFEFFCIYFEGVNGLDSHNTPIFEPFKIQDIILFISSQLFPKKKKKNLVFYQMLSTIMKMIRLLHKYPSMHFFVGWLWLSLLKIYMCQMWKWKWVYEFKSNWIWSRSQVVAKFISN